MPTAAEVDEALAALFDQPDSVYTPGTKESELFDARLIEARRIEAATPVAPTLRDGRQVVWSPQAGSQTEFLACPYFEVLYHGTRGPGKTDGLLMSYGQHVGKFGAAWRGVIFRQTYPQLADVVAKSEKWFRRIFPQAVFNRSRMEWSWPTGEVLMFRHMAKPSDYDNHHGHEYPFIGFEELTNWATDECFTRMFSCCRSSTPGVPRMIRGTTNPYGVGYNWVKARYGLHGKWWNTTVTGSGERARVAIHGHLRENKILLAADPNYVETIRASATNPAVLDAWIKGSWDIVAGSMFDDVWSPAHNIVAPFEIPATWKLDRSFDWGSSAPFSVGWWAESDGTDYTDSTGEVRPTVRGDLFRVAEWYGWTGQPNEGKKLLAVDVAKGIVKRERDEFGARRVRPGPADSEIYSVENGMSVAADMAKPVRFDGEDPVPGVQWTRADKRPGSRKTGWEMVRKMMRNAHPNRRGEPREYPGLFVFNTCEQFIRTVPPAPRKADDMDDLDKKNWEDHVCDEARYRVRCAGVLAPTPGGVGLAGLGPRLVQG